MSFCTLSNEYIEDGYTPIDNIFMLKYLPKASADDIKVYLFGLTLASIQDTQQNDITQMALSLKMPEDKILVAYKYWEQKGLVSISPSFPIKITYHSVKKALPPIIKYDAKKYTTFVEEVARLFPEKILSPNELAEFIELIRVYKVEINAMLMIIKYCIDYKTNKVSTPYILAVANNWIKNGLTTETQVNEHITHLEANSESIRMIFQALGLKRAPDLDDRQLFLKWTKDYKYSLDAILTATKAQKRRGGMDKLDKYIDELKNADAYTAQEIASYTKNKQQIYDLAINIVKNMGGYYASMDIVIETYVVPWIQKGFTHDALLTIAKFCFLKNIRNLDGMEQMVDRFFKLGLLNVDGINSYIDRQVAIDEKIAQIYDKCNHVGIITNRDRQFYHTWINWGFDDELILFVASMSKDHPFPMQTINRNLAILHQKNIAELSQAKKELEKKSTSTVSSPKQVEERYSDEQLKKVLQDFDSWEI